MPVVYIDGKEVELDAADNLLEALLAKGYDLPYFCWHPAMGSVGACRQCAVVQYRDEDDDRGRIVMSCMTPVTDGGLFSVAGDNAADFRRAVVENLMINHPHDCPVCEEGGECHLQDMTVMTGHRDRKYRGRKATFRNQYLGPLINHEMNRCITCYRCVRFYQDYAGGHDLAAFASRDRVYFGRAEEGVLENEFAGNLVEVCPTGVFTDRPLAGHYTRKWDFQSAPSVCSACSLGCNITVSERYGELRRIHNRYNHKVNGYFLCDRGRFGGDFVNAVDRIPYVGVRTGAVFEATPVDDGVEAAARSIRQSTRVIGIGSPRAGVEANYLLGKLVGTDNFFPGDNHRSVAMNRLILEILSGTRAARPTLLETESFDAILVLGEDVTNHAPRLALSLRQAVRHKAFELATDADIPLWNDAAVRKIGQSERSPLIVMTPGADRLDDVAMVSVRETPDEIARLGFEIADAIKAGSTDDSRIRQICDLLKSADKPLIVSGTGVRSEQVIKAAANVANALSEVNSGTGIFLCLDECNSLGLAMLPSSGQGLEELLDGPDIDTAIVLENDLTRRLSPAQFDRLLDKTGRLIVIDHFDNATSSASHIVFPAATFAEHEGTFVNNEGTAQRYFAAFVPRDAIAPAWQWLARIGKAAGSAAFEEFEHIDDVMIAAACEAECEALQGIVDASPPADFRIAGARVPRMTHRYSGRTAIRANVSVHEPQTVQDEESPLAFTMEGSMVNQPGALRPFVWSPGWNSNQSVNKFQEEINGPLDGGDPGVRVHGESVNSTWYTPAFDDSDELPLVPAPHIFGSDELSVRSPAIGELTPRPYFAINPALAGTLGVADGDGVAWDDDDDNAVEVIVDERVADGCVLYPAGIPAMRALANRETIGLRKVANWTPQPGRRGVITSDRTR